MKTNSNPLKSIFYIEVPESFSESINNFAIDKKRKLPIEISNIENWNPEDLTWEMILSAMLKILAYDTENKDSKYFRDFVLAVRPNIVNELTDSGIIKSKDKDFILAEEIFLAIEGLERGNIRNQLNLAVLYEEKADWLQSNGNSDEANKLLNDIKMIYHTLIDDESVLTDVYFNAGYFFIKIREFEKAEACFNTFIEFSDNNEKIDKAKNILSQYKNILGNENIFNDAYNAILEENEHLCIETMTAFLEENPNVWNAWFLLGWAYRRLSNFSESKKALEKALEHNPNESDIINELAICHMEMKDYITSQKFLEKALIINPDDVKIISNMGVIQIRLGEIEKAKNFFETVLLLEPDDAVAKEYLKQIDE